MHDKSNQTALTIGRLVRSERIRQSLRQDELAMAAGVSARAVHQIEVGKTTTQLDTADRVLAALGLRLEVVTRHGDPVPVSEPGRQRVRRS